MCCFSQRVEHVSETSIFARGTPDGRQYLAYSMTLQAAGELAMVLPIASPPSSADDAVQFINLEGYPDLFRDLKSAFPEPVARGFQPQAFSASHSLTVHQVGAFEASFVPSANDFGRLDPRFQLSPITLKALTEQPDFGFVVFKLQAGTGHDVGATSFHPMAFSFPRRDPHRLFLPTVHVHDGTVPKVARFDHDLYVQSDTAPEGWRVSEEHAGAYISEERALGLVRDDAFVFHRPLSGPHPNRDTWVG